MIKICVIGTGNLGFHLCQFFNSAYYDVDNSAFAKANLPKSEFPLQLTGYYNTSGSSLQGIEHKQFFNYNSIPVCDLIIIAVPDDAIKNVSLQIPKNRAIVVHTSGTVSMKALKNHEHRGVFYLPQSFSRSKTPDFSKIPLCLESSDDHVREVLHSVGKNVSTHLVEMDSKQRKQLHLAAVYMNNFVNHCYAKSYEILEKAAIPTNALDHLMRETMLKAIDLTPALAQTGPAKRNDTKTIKAHLDLLPESERALYQIITQSIQNKNNEL